MENIDEWAQNVNDGSGAGAGTGYGSGSGSGSGSVGGYGPGHGSGFGDGSGSGSGFGDGYGSGYGSGLGYGFSDGTGSDYGYGYDKISRFNFNKVYNIDNINTIIEKIKGNIAKGYILNDNFTLETTYIAKNEKYFAHGKTIKEAVQSLREKIYETLDKEEAIEKFIEEVDINKKHKASEFYIWHHILTGSCKQGRNNFMKNHGINEDDEFTVQQFIDMTKNDDFGGEIIKHLEERIKQ